MFKSVRQHRYEVLKTRGFTNFEAVQYSKIPFYSDVIKYMVRERTKEYRKAGSPNINSVKWQRQVKASYEMHGWEWGDKVGAWRQYRLYEQIWRERHPGEQDKWKSPPKKEDKKRYRQLNRDLIKKQKEKYRQKHAAQIKAYAKEYRLKKSKSREH